MYNPYLNKKACSGCEKSSLCTKAETRIINRDQKEEVKERMCDKFNKKKNKELYKRRAHSCEAPYGHIKHNLKFKTIMRRGIEKVKMEMALLGILHNGLKCASILL